MSDQPKPEPTLADQFLADLGKYPATFKLKGRTRKMAEEYASKYRQEMRKAHRFVLDDAFTRYSSEVSTRTEDPKKLLYRLQFATLPYEYTWIEFDARAKMRVIRAIHRPGVVFQDEHEIPERMGMLLHRMTDTTWVCTIVCAPTTEGMPVVPNLLSYLVALDEREFDRERTYDDCEVLKAGKLFESAHEASRHITNFAKAALWGYGNFDGKPDGLLDAKQAAKSQPILPTFLERHGDAAMSRMFNVFTARAAADADSAERFEKLAEVAAVEMREFTGFMRWLVTVLAMLNEVPLRARHVQPSGEYRTRMGSKKLLDYHTLTLHVPKLRPIPYIERKLSNRAHKNRAHEVRSHWRTYLGDDPCRREEHNWEYDHDEGYRLCGTCMSFSRLIHEHVRGDATLGWTQKHYVVEKSREAA